MLGGGKARPVRVLFSYSHRDEALRDELGDHLVPLERAGLITVWHDRRMLPGDSIDDEIARRLRTADVILVLVSPSFIRSSYCYDIEFENAIERHKEGKARVVPVILRPCQWDLTPLKDLLAMPTDGRPVIEWPKNDTAFNDIAAGIRKLAVAIREKGIGAAGLAAAGAKPTVGQLPLIADFAVFRDIDAPWCPEMVALPRGEFFMGSAAAEEGRYRYEGPKHKVEFAYRFAIGSYSVTFEEYDHFCDATRRESPSDEDWGCGKRPVINVTWWDAVAYCHWLAKEAGGPYRLPSEAEWEYACRAGTTTRYSVGDQITEKDANFSGRVGKTIEVGRYALNAWELHDMHGNVWEWVEDVWHGNYNGAPSDGSAWTDPEGGNSTCIGVYRGGSWVNDSWDLRSASRVRDDRGNASYNLGFRVARTLA